jgi:ABC-2 type transport system permease protein
VIERSPLLELTLARLRLYYREPGAIFWSFGFPILMSLALGVAFRNRPPEPVAVAVARAPGADAIYTLLAADPDLRASLLAPADAANALRVGKVALVVEPGEPVTYRFDPARPESRLARALADDAVQSAAGRTDPARVRDAKVTEKGGRYIDFLVPGIIGLNLLSAGMWGIGYVIVETRTKKLLKRMLATPMRRSDFLLSFVLMRLLFVVVELPVLLGFAYLAFDVTVRGSLALFTGMAFLGAFAFAGLGVLVASRAQNTATIGGLVNLVMLPMFVLSGVFFSSANFPEVMQPFIKALPLTALNDALRAIMNDGAGFAAVAPQAALLAGLAAVTFGLGLKLFRWS